MSTTSQREKTRPMLIVLCALLNSGMLGIVLLRAAENPSESSVAECLVRVQEIHGEAGPWAVTGYRIGQKALKELNLPRFSKSLRVTHRAPEKVQFSCMVDGLQAATGASLGKLNLRLETASFEELSSRIEDTNSGRILTFTLKPAFQQSIVNLSRDELPAAGKRVAQFADDQIFELKESQQSK